MAISLGSNIASLQAQRRLADSTKALGTSFERLSSGLRINRAADDAAGLALSENLRSDTRVYTQAVRNLNDGLGLLSVADSALEELSSIVIRVRELAQEASNGVYTSDQREALDSEAQSLAEEYYRIVETTEFNDQALFSPSFGTLRLQGGYGSNGGIQSSLGGARGTGTFTSNSTLSEVGSSNSIALGDLNGDGFVDMVTGGTGATGTATVRLGAGTGSFGTAVSYSVDTTSTSEVALGDLNNDGILDIVSGGLSGTTSSISVRIGNGDGTFLASTSTSLLTASSTVLGLSLGDFNQDGNVDVLSLAQNGSNATAILNFGTGAGTFSSAFTHTLFSGSGQGATAADTNDDGILDIVALKNGSIEILRGVGDGTFVAAVTTTVSFTSSGDIVFDDFNEDGITDYLVTGVSISARFAVALGQGNGTFGTTTSYTLSNSLAESIALGDYNGDGHVDVATSANLGAAFAVRLGNGNGSFGALTAYSTGGAGGGSDIATADFNSDGVLDLAAAGSNGSPVAFVRIGDTSVGVSPLLSFSLKTKADALQSIGPLEQKLDQLTVQRGVVGAFQSRLESSVNNLQIARENFQTAYSRITDVDVAEEAAKLVRGKILQQASTAVLSQANNQPQIALKLLKGSSDKTS